MLTIMLISGIASAEPISATVLVGLAVKYGPAVVEWLREETARADSNRDHQAVRACMARWELEAPLDVSKFAVDEDGENSLTLIKQCAPSAYPWTGSNLQIYGFGEDTIDGQGSFTFLGLPCDRARVVYVKDDAEISVNVTRGTVVSFLGEPISPDGIGDLARNSGMHPAGFVLGMAAVRHPATAKISRIVCKS